MHEGNGVARTIVDEQTTKEQRDALIALPTGQHGGTYWEIFASVCSHVLEPHIAQISLSVDREKRCASIRISDLAESEIEPIKNPKTGDELRARIALPNGFEYKEA